MLTLLLGHDPFTGRRTAPSPQTLTAGVLALAPGGPAFYQTLRQSGVLPAAAELLAQAAQRHGLSLARVQLTLTQARQGYEQASFWHPLAGFHRVVDPFEHLAQDVYAFAAEVLEPLLELVFTKLAGPQAKRVLSLLRQAGHTYRTIMADPVAFLGHLVSAARLGFAGFTERATTHLQQGLSEWILGPLGKLNLVLPPRFDAAGVLTLGLQVLELTYPQLRPKLVDRFGQPLVHALETGAGVLHTLATQGVKAAGQELQALAQDLVGQLREQVESGVRAWVARTLLGRLVVELAKLLVPASAIISAIEKVYTTVMFFVEKASKFQALVSTIVGALPAIAAGQVGTAAGAVEQTLGRLVPLALGFVADFIGLGGLTDAVRAQLQKAREWVQRIIQRLLEKVGKLVGTSKHVAGQAIEAVTGFFGVRTEFDAGPERHSLYFALRKGRSVLIIESTPTEIDEFLDHLQQHYPKAAAKTADIAAIKAHLGTYHPVYQQLSSAGLSNARQQVYHRQLLRKNVELSKMLSELLGSTTHTTFDDKGNARNLIADENRYKLEGTTGVYSNSIQTSKDNLTFDHQPQGEVLIIASSLRFPAPHPSQGQLVFDPANGFHTLANRAFKDAKGGYAILLSAIRHEQGRTFFGKGKANAQNFRKLTGNIIASTTAADTTADDQKKRDEVVELLKDELKADAQTMINLMRAAISRGKFDEPTLWGDIDGGWQPNKKTPVAPGVQQKFPTGNDADNDYRKALKQRIAVRIIQGEQELLAQPMDELKRK